MAGQPIDSQEFNRAVQRAVEASYTRTFSHISEIQKRIGNLERSERANLVSIESLAQLPPAHAGALAFIKDIATWYYCDGVDWLPVAGGATGGGMEIHTLASNVGLGSYHTVSGATDGDAPTDATAAGEAGEPVAETEADATATADADAAAEVAEPVADDTEAVAED